MTYEWRKRKPLRADVAVGLIQAIVLDEAGQEKTIEMEIGIPCLIHQEAGLVWASDEPFPLGPGGLRMAQLSLVRFMKKMAQYWPEAADAVDWGFVLAAPKSTNLMVPGSGL
jgi:hypothetical protein